MLFKHPLLNWGLLRTRIIIGMSVVAVIVLWIATLVVNRTLRTEMEKGIAAQQYSVVSLVASEIDRSVRDRLWAVEQVAAHISPAMMGKPDRLQAYIEQDLMVSRLFNWGGMVLDRRGVAIASTPASLGRRHIAYDDLPFFVNALSSDESFFTEPMLGKQTGQPVVTAVAPIKDENGRVIGLVLGINNLAQANFLDAISDSHYGNTGEFIVTAPRSRLYIASSNRQRTLKPGPPQGVNAVYDRYIEGYEGSGVAVSSRGILELSSSRRVPSSGWLVQSVLPAAEAFAPVRDIQRRLVLISMVLSVLAAILTWWWLRRQLWPLTQAANQLQAMRDGRLPRQPLPVYRNDELGALATAFNGLLAAIVAEEAKAVEHASNERLRKIVAHIPGVVFQYRLFPDGHGCFPFASEAFYDIYGIHPAEVAERADKIREMLHPEDAERFFSDLYASAKSLSLWRVEYRICFPDGRIKWLLVEAMPEKDDEGAITWYGFVADISQAKAMEAELHVAATTFQTQEGIVVTDAQGCILRVNAAFTQVTGYASDEVVGKTPAILASGRQDEAFYRRMWAELLENGRWQGEIWNRRKSGEVYPEWLTITAVNDDKGKVSHYVGSFQDITARKSAEEEIRNLAFFDPLTRLPNRRLLLDRLQQALAASARNVRRGALLFLDLDNFKTLNDTLGHDVGDLLLIAVAQRLQSNIREGDTVSRLGGDEFIVMLEDLSEEMGEAAAQAETVANKILAALNEPYLLGRHEYRSTPSIGITLFHGRESGVDELLKRADLAMYQAKSGGRNTLRFFDPAMQASVNARSQMEHELRRAIADEEFVLFYQPQVDQAQRCIGAEALIRWQNPRRGLISPLEFIPLAEDSGLIVAIGHWVLQEACRQIRAWQNEPLTAALTLAVNVSPRQFQQRDFVATVQALVDDTGIDPARLKLEITESLLLSDIDAVIVKMDALRGIGVGFSLDDFGTGYSSLAYLKRLPFDQVKIDQSFVRDVLSDPNDAAICRAVIALGRSLGLGVIAEGVETDRQWEFLQAEGCLQAQGYLYAKPMPASDLQQWLHR